LLATAAAVCFAISGLLWWWAIIVAGKAFEPYQDNTDAVYLSIAAMGALLGAAAALLASLLVVHIDSRGFKGALAMAAAVLAVIPYAAWLGEVAYSLDLTPVLLSLVAFASLLRHRETAH
jgi:hypothetical protein